MKIETPEQYKAVVGRWQRVERMLNERDRRGMPPLRDYEDRQRLIERLMDESSFDLDENNNVITKA